eukprot:3724187-Prymnesium_polylepis.1
MSPPPPTRSGVRWHAIAPLAATAAALAVSSSGRHSLLHLLPYASRGDWDRTRDGAVEPAEVLA